MVQVEPANWNEERLMVEAERVRWDEERARNNVERMRWKENTSRLTKERDSVLEEHEQCQRVRKALEDELSRVLHELQVSKVGYGSLQEQLASKNTSIMALETRVRQFEEVSSRFFLSHRGHRPVWPRSYVLVVVGELYPLFA